MTLPTFEELHGHATEVAEGWFETLKRTIAIDFDGVLHPYTDGWVGSVPTSEPPCDGALDFLLWCIQKRYNIVAFSTRADHKEGLEGIVNWLEANDLMPFVSNVTHVKPAAFAYVDDRAVPYTGSWGNVMVDVTRLAEKKSRGAAR